MKKPSYLLSLFMLVGALGADDIELYEKKVFYVPGTLPASVNPTSTINNQVYMGLFQPSTSTRWQGNLKLYRIGLLSSKGAGNQNSQPILLDGDNKPAVEVNSNRFKPQARSFWTAGKDAPDGPIVNLGGAAQSLRDYIGIQRKNFTCTGSCTSMALFSEANPHLQPTQFGVTDVEEMNAIIQWSQQGHGDVIHSKALLIDYGGQQGTYAFYGSNDGMFHGVKVGLQEKKDTITAKDGEEQWAFTAPQHFIKLAQLYKNRDSELTSFSDKLYFFDGPISTYTSYPSSDSLRTDSFEEAVFVKKSPGAIIFLTARRGGRLIYALDVSDPKNPKILWHKTHLDEGFSELGQTWSKPIVRKVQVKSSGVEQGRTVLFMGLGYDPVAEDQGGVRTQGRGMIMLDALTGEIIWQHNSMVYAVPSNITVVDRDDDGYIDRAYFANTGGQLWRVDMDRQDSSLWQPKLLLELSGGQKFFNAPDVVTSESGSYYGIIIGSGDREKPFSKNTQNHLIFYRDYCVDAKDSACTAKAKTLLDLQQLKNPRVPKSPLVTEKLENGWYLPLEIGEKAVTRSITSNYTTVFATHIPSCTSSRDQADCNSLGQARIYQFNPFSFDDEEDSDPDTKPRNDRETYYRQVEGGGLLPDPVPFRMAVEPPSCSGEACDPGGKIISGLLFGGVIDPIQQPALGIVKKTWWHSFRDDLP